MSTVAHKLRRIAAELDAMHVSTGPVLVPMPAHLVEVGNVARFTTHERVRITAVKVTEKSNTAGFPLISFEAEVVDATEFSPRFDHAFANEWVVVER